MKNKILLFGILVFMSVPFFAQIAPDTYYVQFTDKNNSPYSINNPEAFLTQRAIDRRDVQDIAIVENDLPVNPQYLAGVAGTGAEILWPTKWLNGVTIFTESQTVIDAINDLSYVQTVLSLEGGDGKHKKAFFENESIGVEQLPEYTESGRSINELNYGWAEFQIDQINGIPLHNAGFQGQGMLIAVLDGGFEGVDTHELFDSLWVNDQILGTQDYVNKGGSVYTDSQHGKNVLSCMAANQSGVMIGTAPKANYWLLRSEDINSENVIEEYNWISAAEFADSVGADVINSSLSYVDFELPEWDHDYSDLDGNTAVSTRAADFATSKGMLICNSAGNSGEDSQFPWNGAPADADSVFSVGAVRDDNQRASFSSHGPTVDGRIKPAIMGLGQGTTVANGTVSGVTFGSGTSYSSPIIAGMSTCLWQANPDMTVMEVQAAIKQSGSYSQNPDNYMGWGIPDYEKANWIMTTVENETVLNEDIVKVWPNPFISNLNIEVNIENSVNVDLELRYSSGDLIIKQTLNLSEYNPEIYLSNVIDRLPSGVYFLRVIADTRVQVVRLVKQ